MVGKLDGDLFDLYAYKGSYKYLGITADYKNAKAANSHHNQLKPKEEVSYKVNFCSHYKFDKVNQSIKVSLHDDFIVNGESIVIQSNTINITTLEKYGGEK